MCGTVWPHVRPGHTPAISLSSLASPFASKGDGVLWRRLVLVFGGAGAAHDASDAGHEFCHLHGEDELGG